MSTELQQLCRRMDKLEKDVEGVKSMVHTQQVVDAQVKEKIEALSSQFVDLKVDVITQLSSFTKNTWRLIFILVGIVAALVGIKTIPTLL